MKTLLPSALLTLAALAGCNDKTPTPTPASSFEDVQMELGIKGYAAMPTAVGSFGIAGTEVEARLSKATITSGSLSWTESNSGKDTKKIVIPQRRKGETLWIFMAGNRKPKAGQSITLDWAGGHSLSVTSATDSLVVSSFVVGQ